ncbi:MULTISPECIES: cytochrome aa3 quinol oxidase subunit IV [Niallia]|uniref:Quinol oxidase subunit 4 n=1 Tax=Niallia circulans TaxID=1397 RepID=A0A553SGZ4_NIACI|nr:MULTISPECIES: cytochrome aa3 quinol oxidase subunit IV [Niallia]MCT2345192.1 cytochrome aa3 quinol oxidase subunit IV [Niallia taxi]MDE5055727.1 cytochrome aa3 quinol oxidase subunit IV [Niallia taxi]MED3961412.1 cytochrome aa3 quinol oxidase subunit IV [Niallia taxi]TRZ36250.1 cytochrome aa3 quinol oxidase subunit IV [Niallia circulans]WOD63005.1 cytochrome aa3 quinol oxidase subunit IV [Niallia taxi]
MAKHNSSFPTGHVAGFIVSILLTFATVGAVRYTDLPFVTIMWIIGSLAVIQALLQLFMFMHLTEGEGKMQLINIFYAFFCAIVVAAGTIWVMTSGHVHY